MIIPLKANKALTEKGKIESEIAVNTTSKKAPVDHRFN